MAEYMRGKYPEFSAIENEVKQKSIERNDGQAVGITPAEAVPVDNFIREKLTEEGYDGLIYNKKVPAGISNFPKK